jgi:hypothetical protein
MISWSDPGVSPGEGLKVKSGEPPTSLFSGGWGYTPWRNLLKDATVSPAKVVMKETPLFELTEMNGRAALLHDLRHALFVIHLAPLLLEKHRQDEPRFHEICEGLSRECGSIAVLIEEEFGEVNLPEPPPLERPY